jgi:hypothetical protein
MSMLWPYATTTNTKMASIWLPYKRFGPGAVFSNIYNQQAFNTSLWSTGQPGLYKNCLTCTPQGCQTEDCRNKNVFFCTIDRWPVVAKLRGLCSKTALSLSYYPSLKLGSFAWISIGGTYIVYNSTAQMWQIAVADSSVRAEAPASYESFLIGTNRWTVYNSFNCYAGKTVDIKVSLAFCPEEQFNCDDGGCIDIVDKCDGQNNCQDGSDELNCIILQLPSNYNKLLSPLYMSQTKASVNVTFEVMDILNVDEKMGKFRVKFNLSVLWNDFRVNYLDLWYEYALNSISKEEMDLIWRPTLNFDNAELDLFDYNIKPQIFIVYNMSTTSTKASPSQLYKAVIFNGAENNFYLRSIIRYSKRCSN